MNQLTPTLVLCMLQVTAFALLACVIQLVLRRRSPASRSAVTLSALVVIVGVSLLSFSPWPNWTQGWWQAAPPTAEVVEPRTMPAESAGDVPLPHSPPAPIELESMWAAAWNGFKSAVQNPAPAVASEASPRITTSVVVGLALLLGIIVGLTRLIGGWLAVGRMKRHSRRITDTKLQEEVEVLQAALHCPGRVELLETDRLTTAATVGWRRPFILLPTGWRDWTPTERQAVLAHEIAHIHHRDYAAWLVAQLGVVLHFYHPLVHWLAARLRIDQELAADAAAAPLVGGRQTYLETLAALALRNSDRGLSWPVRAFLPTRHTFLRRLEMLRDPRQLTTSSPGRIRWLSVVGMVLAGLAIAGLRGPAASKRALAADPPATPPLRVVKEGEGIRLRYVPRDAALVFGVRPERLLASKTFKPVLDSITGEAGVIEQIGLAADQIEELTGVILLTADGSGGNTRPDSPAFVVRTRADGQAQQIAKKLAPNAAASTFDRKEIFVDSRAAYALPDARTLLFAGSEATLRRMLIAGADAQGTQRMMDSWVRVKGDDLAVAANMELLSLVFGQATSNPNPPNPWASLSPVLNQSLTASIGVQLDDQFVVHGFAFCDSEQNAEMLKGMLTAGRVMARNGLSTFRSTASQGPAERSAMNLRLADFADELLERTSIEQSQGDVTFSLTGSAPTAAQLVETLIPALKQARVSATRSQDMNNMNQIMLAMHNYHDVCGSFPPAVIRDKSGKPLYSWRVALLPFVEQAPLYDKLHRNEPWDSPHNKPLLEKIPAVFKSPVDPAESNNASYFVFTGEHTAFSEPGGTKMEQFFDGTSNTISIVEAKRDIHWAQPEDIPFDADQPLPEVGGHYPGLFLAGMCDGSVQTFPLAIKPEILKLMIMRDDGKPIDWNSL